MIDIHCHILPSVDDGASTLAESLSMAREAANQGIHTIIATPHHQNGFHENPGNHIAGMVDYVNGKMKAEQIPVSIKPGQEPQMHGDIIEELKSREVIPLAGASDYVLVALPENEAPSYATNLLFDMQIAGYKPIIAHPEQNHALMDNPDKLYRLVKNGALTQLSAASIVGKNGSRVRKFTNQIIEANLAQFIASDAHHAKRHGFYMKTALQVIKNKYGAFKERQFRNNSEAVVHGIPINANVPERIKRKKLLGIL